MTSLLRDFLTFSAHQRPTIGDTKMSVTNSDHLGWLKCDGRSLSVADYNLLFQIIGYSFGGSGDYFNLPAAAGHVLGITNNSTVGDSGVDQDGNALSQRLLGANVGYEQSSITIAQMPAHDHEGMTGSSNTFITHNATGPTVDGGNGHSLAYCDGNNTYNGSQLDPTPREINLFGTATALELNDPGHSHSIASQGNNQPINRFQPTLFVGNMFIYSGKYNSAVSQYPYNFTNSPLTQYSTLFTVL